MSKQISCRNCGNFINMSDMFCNKCGSKNDYENPQEKKCLKCGTTITEGSKFCSKCGTASEDTTINLTKSTDGNTLSCPKCGRRLSLSSSKCDVCGTTIKSTNNIKEQKNTSQDTSNENKVYSELLDYELFKFDIEQIKNDTENKVIPLKEASSFQGFIILVAFIFFKVFCKMGWIISFILTCVVAFIIDIPRSIRNKAAQNTNETNEKEKNKIIEKYESNESYKRITKIITDNDGDPDDKELISRMIEYSQYNPSVPLSVVISKCISNKNINNVIDKIPSFIKETKALEKLIKSTNKDFIREGLEEELLPAFKTVREIEEFYKKNKLDQLIEFNPDLINIIPNMMNTVTSLKNVLNHEISENKKILDKFNDFSTENKEIFKKFQKMFNTVRNHSIYFPDDFCDLMLDMGNVLVDLLKKEAIVIQKCDNDFVAIKKNINMLEKIHTKANDIFEGLNAIFSDIYDGSNLEEWNDIENEFDEFMSSFDDEYYNDYDYNQDDSDNSTGFFQGCNDLESLKKRYKALSRLYHPDMENGDMEMMQKINAEFDRLKQLYE